MNADAGFSLQHQTDLRAEHFVDLVGLMQKPAGLHRLASDRKGRRSAMLRKVELESLLGIAVGQRVGAGDVLVVFESDDLAGSVSIEQARKGHVGSDAGTA